LAIQAGYDGYGFNYVLLGQREYLAIVVVEADSDVAGHFYMLPLVRADWDQVTVENEYVGGLEDRIRKQTMIRAETLGDFIFVACAPLQEANRRYAGKQPGQFGDLGHIGLSPEHGFLCVKSQRYVIRRKVKDVLGQVGRGWIAGQGVVVGDEVEAVVFGLKLELLTHRPEEVAYMKPAGRLDA
jgi:hypothetical protein